MYLITCEHGGNEVPTAFARLFRGHRRLLATHRGYDAGALELARAFSRRLDAPLVYSTTTRLLVDLNRSPGHRRLFSEFTRDLDSAAKAAILAAHYTPYRQRVEALVAEAVGRGDQVLHLSVHSFTPALDGEVRNADIGLLYDPARRGERPFCHRWRSSLTTLRPGLRVRCNYPYRGVSDGLVTSLRRRFRPNRYLGIELEVNQLWPLGDPQAWCGLQETLLMAVPG
ncbi:MAG: N-formylglutamate amidohydrolase [Thermoguttaceae bacterium]|jgi:predicted N-formylglutamate amidohydrolase